MINLEQLATDNNCEGYCYSLIPESSFVNYSANIRLLFASWLMEAEETAEEYGGVGDWSLGLFYTSTCKQHSLFNDCWLRVPLHGVNKLSPGYGLQVTKLDGRVTQHKAKWIGVYVCAFLNLTVA